MVGSYGVEVSAVNVTVMSDDFVPPRQNATKVYCGGGGTVNVISASSIQPSEKSNSRVVTVV